MCVRWLRRAAAIATRAFRCASPSGRNGTEIEAAINRPVPPVMCGPCPAPVEQDHDKDCDTQHPHRCATALTAPEGDVEVTCPSCKATHNVAALTTKLLYEASYMQCTINELCETVLPRLGEGVPRATLHSWHTKGWLQPKGFRRVRGKSIPLFVVMDVRQVRLQRERERAGKTK